MSNFLDTERKQFKFQRVADGLIICTFYPYNRFLPKSYEVIVKKTSRFFDLFDTVESFDRVNWWTLNYLAQFCETYNGCYLT